MRGWVSVREGIGRCCRLVVVVATVVVVVDDVCLRASARLRVCVQGGLCAAPVVGGWRWILH